jgi:hypothetical protein
MADTRKYTTSPKDVQHVANGDTGQRPPSHIQPLPLDYTEEPLPQIGWFNVAELLVDYAYQHNPYREAIDDLKKVFRRELMGMILINIRPDGTKYIIDGNTRVTVCRELRIRRVCAEMKEGMTQAEEADAYTVKAINTQRQPVDLFKAECIAKKPDAVLIQTILAAHNIEVKSFASEHGPRTAKAYISCVATLKRLLRQERRYLEAQRARGDMDGERMELGNHLKNTLGLIVETWDYESGALGGALIETIHDLLFKYDKLVHKTFKLKLGNKSLRDLREDARVLRYAKTPQPSLRKAMQEKILELYNLGLPKERRIEYGS